MSQRDMSYAEVLGLSKQVILQQSERIKNDQAKLSQFQEQNRDLYEQVTQMERRLQVEQSKCHAVNVDLENKASHIQKLEAELTGMNRKMEELEQLAEEQKAELSRIQAEVDAIRKQIPTEADEKALQDLAALLSRAEQVARRTVPLAQAA